MKVEYYAETDTMAVVLHERPVVESRLLAPNVVASVDDRGEVVLLEFTGKVSEEFAPLLEALTRHARRRSA